jgi:hypothetical protein
VGTLFNLRACRSEGYRGAASLRNIFRNFMAPVDTATLPLAILPPRKSQMLPQGVNLANGDVSIWSLVRRNAAASRLSRRAMTVKYLSLMEIRSKKSDFLPQSCPCPLAIRPQADK